jgi:hypothetical protein
MSSNIRDQRGTEVGEKCPNNLAYNWQHGANGFTSLLKEGMLRIFSPEKSDGFGRERTRDLGYQRPAC